jgi:RNA polymerase sigma-70 factor (ECF subfamily)
MRRKMILMHSDSRDTNLKDLLQKQIRTDYDFRELIGKCNLGDRQAWEEFYSRYFAMISRVARKYCSAAPAEAEEIEQEIFLNLFKALRKFDPTKSVEAYILEIARRVTISRYRKSTAIKRGGKDSTHVPLSAHDYDREAGYISVRSADEDQETALIKAEREHILRKALKSVSESCRRLLGLRYDRGLSYKEIATIVGVKEGALRVRVQRCLSTLSDVYSSLAPQEV